jgi:hypothetical protein
MGYCIHVPHVDTPHAITIPELFIVHIGAVTSIPVVVLSSSVLRYIHELKRDL